MFIILTSLSDSKSSLVWSRTLIVKLASLIAMAGVTWLPNMTKMIYDFLGGDASGFVVEHDFVPDLKNVFVSLQEKFKCAVGAQIMVKHLQATIVNNVEVKKVHKK